MRTVMLFFALFATGSVWGLTGDNLLGDRPVNVDPSGKAGEVVVFLSARCPCSKSHVGVLKTLAREYPKFAFVAVHANADEPRAEAHEYFKGAELPFPVIEDHGFKLADEFGASRTPHAFVRTAAGRIVYRGGVTDSHDGAHAKHAPLREALTDLNAGKPVRNAEARSLGCWITRE